MVDSRDLQRLEEVRAMIAAANVAITSLMGKTKQSVSFGDQSFSIVDVEKLLRVRDLLRNEEQAIERRVHGRPRRTIKIHFPC